MHSQTQLSDDTATLSLLGSLLSRGLSLTKSDRAIALPLLRTQRK